MTSTEASESETNIVREWISRTVGYPQYFSLFLGNGYNSMRAIQAIRSKAELKAIGIVILGHQTLILSEIEKIEGMNVMTDTGEVDEDFEEGQNETEVAKHNSFDPEIEDMFDPQQHRATHGGTVGIGNV